MDLTIIIPVFNVEQYLTQCLDSVFGQNLTNVEVICVNDGSTDGSREILNLYKYKYPNLIIIDRENGGLIKARNTGYKVACGKYIYYLDSDDYLYPNVVSIILKFALSNSLDVALFNGDNDSGDSYYNLKQEINDVLAGSYYFEYFFKMNNFFPPAVQWLYLYRKEFLDLHNIFFPEDNLQEDEPFTVKAFFYAERVAVLNHPIIFHRVFRLGSITQRAHLPHLIDSKIAWSDLYNHLKDNNCLNKYFYFKIFSLYQNTITKLTNDKLIKYRKGFLAKSDLKIMRSCAINPDLFKYYWYYNFNFQLFKWYLASNRAIFIKKVLNRFIVLYYKLFVVNE